MRTNLMKVPSGFKIRKKEDVEKFINNCMLKGGQYYIKADEETAYVIEKDTDDEVRVLVKKGDLTDVFNPLLEVACTDKPDTYKITVTESIWKLRKYINAKYFNI